MRAVCDLLIHVGDIVHGFGNCGECFAGILCIFKAAYSALTALLHGDYRVVGAGMEILYHGLDIGCRLLCSAGERSHLIGYHCKPATLFAGARGLDSRIQCHWP